MHLSAGKLHNCRLLSEESYGKALLHRELQRCTGGFRSTGRVYMFAYVHVCMSEDWIFITRCFHNSTSLKFPRQKQKDIVLL